MTYGEAMRLPPHARRQVEKAFSPEEAEKPIGSPAGGSCENIHGSLLTNRADGLQDELRSGTQASGVTDEIDELHRPILAWVKERGWPCMYANSSKPTRLTVGWPDFTIACPGKKLLLIECKSKDGDLSKEQSAMRSALARQGFYVWIVRSMQDFAEAVAKTVL